MICYSIYINLGLSEVSWLTRCPYTTGVPLSVCLRQPVAFTGKDDRVHVPLRLPWNEQCAIWLKTWVLSSLHGHRFCQLLSMACIFQTGETKTCRGTHVWIVCTRGSSRFKTTSLPLLLSLYVFHTPIPLLSWYVCCVLEHPSFLPHSVGNATNLGSGWTSPKCCVPWPPPQ